MASHPILSRRGYGPRAIWRRLVLGLARCVFDNCDFYLVLTSNNKKTARPTDESRHPFARATQRPDVGH